VLVELSSWHAFSLLVPPSSCRSPFNFHPTSSLSPQDSSHHSRLIRLSFYPASSHKVVPLSHNFLALSLSLSFSLILFSPPFSYIEFSSPSLRNLSVARLLTNTLQPLPHARPLSFLTMLPLDGHDGGGSGGSGGVSVPPYPPKHKHRDRARMHVSTRAFPKAYNFVTPAPSETQSVVYPDEGNNRLHSGHRTVKPNVRVLQFGGKIKCRACYLPIGRQWSARCSNVFVRRGWWLGMRARGRLTRRSLIVVNMLPICAINVRINCDTVDWHRFMNLVVWWRNHSCDDITHCDLALSLNQISDRSKLARGIMNSESPYSATSERSFASVTVE